ncbi:LuxR C-terminal-related transcriptional regulator [Amycolatopsis sp. NPDC059090]|uniref:helix-turn-helix transcriptional regulator n=1 Tax=unclassified Amycolatopsis TaxID=2618356 RepID=UPI00366E1F7C
MGNVRVAVRASDIVTGVGLASFLETHPLLTVVPCALPLEADVLVFASDSLDTDSAAALRSVTGRDKARVVLIAEHFSEANVIAAVECGVVSVLPLSGSSGADLVDTVLEAAERPALDPRLLAELMDQIRRMGRPAPGSGQLTAREIAILRMLADGLDTQQIAEQLCYSVRTVKNVLHVLLSRKNLRNRQHAVAYAVRAGLI